MGHVRYISISQYGSEAVSRQTSIFGVVFFVSKSLFGIERLTKKIIHKHCNVDRKASEENRCSRRQLDNVCYSLIYINTTTFLSPALYKSTNQHLVFKPQPLPYSRYLQGRIACL